jgi:hypothetical protein
VLITSYDASPAGSELPFDNGSDHRGKAAADLLRRAHPNAIMIHTPVHASWLNQIPVNLDSRRADQTSPPAPSVSLTRADAPTSTSLAERTYQDH